MSGAGGGQQPGRRPAAVRRPARTGRRLDVIALQRYDAVMPAQKRVTVYFDPVLHRALRLKAAETDRSLSDLVNDAIRRSLAEDAEDLEAFAARVREPNLPFEGVVRDLRRRGKL